MSVMTTVGSMGPRPWRLAALALAAAALAACDGGRDAALEQALRADLALAAGAPGVRSGYVSPTELGYPPGAYPAPAHGYQPAYPPSAYPPAYPPPAYGYPAGAYPAGAVMYVAPAPAPAPTRVVYRTPSPSAGGSGSGGGTGGTGQGTGVVTENNTKRGAIIGGATGAAVGIMTSRDKVKGGAVGAITGAVLGGVVGSQIYTQPRSQRRN
jgi:hypothetical protein